MGAGRQVSQGLARGRQEQDRAGSGQLCFSEVKTAAPGAARNPRAQHHSPWPSPKRRQVCATGSTWPSYRLPQTNSPLSSHTLQCSQIQMRPAESCRFSARTNQCHPDRRCSQQMRVSCKVQVAAVFRFRTRSAGMKKGEGSIPWESGGLALG